MQFLFSNSRSSNYSSNKPLCHDITLNDLSLLDLLKSVAPKFYSIKNPVTEVVFDVHIKLHDIRIVSRNF